MGSKEEEKANGKRMFQKLETVFRIFNLTAALLICYRYSLISLALQAFRHSYFTLLPLFHDPLYAFLLLNSIILSLYLFPLNNNASNHFPHHANLTAATALPAKIPDLIAPLIPARSVPLKSTRSAPVKPARSVPAEIPEEIVPVKHIVTTVLDSSEKTVKRFSPPEVGTESPVSKATFTAVARKETTVNAVASNRSTTPVAALKKKCYRRSRSERSNEAETKSGKAELRRVKTGLGKTNAEEWLCQLDKEEFNRAVDDFIAKQKRMLRGEEEQQTDQNQSQQKKTEYLDKEEFNRTVDKFIAKHKRMLWEEQFQSIRATKTDYN